MQGADDDDVQSYDDVVQVTVREFLGALDPPMDQYTRHFIAAGIKTDDDLHALSNWPTEERAALVEGMRLPAFQRRAFLNAVVCWHRLHSAYY